MNHHLRLRRDDEEQNFYDDWALESFDFGCLEDDDDENDLFDDVVKPGRLLMNDCSHADTLSTAGESSSWGSNSESYQYTHQHGDESALGGMIDDSEHSLTLDDIKAFFVEDQVGIFDPTRADDLPPPKARTDFKGDSQNSFTLDDLAFFEDIVDESENDTQDNSNNANEGSLGCLLIAPSQGNNNKRSSIQSRKSKRKSSLLGGRRRSSNNNNKLKGILKNGTSDTRRSSSLTMLLMEDSTMLQMSLSEVDGSYDYEDEERWSFFQQQQSFGDDAFDLQELLGSSKGVEFSTVVVHEHALIVGDNPSVHEGAPLSLEWEAQETHTYESLEAYEEEKEANAASSNSSNNHHNSNHKCGKCKCAKARRLDAEERLFRLLNAGVSLQEIQEAEARTNRIRSEREATKQQHLLLQGSLNSKSAKLFWKALQQKEESSERYPQDDSTDEGQPNGLL